MDEYEYRQAEGFLVAKVYNNYGLERVLISDNLEDLVDQMFEFFNPYLDYHRSCSWWGYPRKNKIQKATR